MFTRISHTAIAYCAVSVLNLCVCALLAFLTVGVQPSAFATAFAAYWVALGVFRPFRIALAVVISHCVLGIRKRKRGAIT